MLALISRLRRSGEGAQPICRIAVFFSSAQPAGRSGAPAEFLQMQVGRGFAYDGQETAGREPDGARGRTMAKLWLFGSLAWMAVVTGESVRLWLRYRPDDVFGADDLGFGLGVLVLAVVPPLLARLAAVLLAHWMPSLGAGEPSRRR